MTAGRCGTHWRATDTRGAPGSVKQWETGRSSDLSTAIISWCSAVAPPSGQAHSTTSFSLPPPPAQRSVWLLYPMRPSSAAGGTRDEEKAPPTAGGVHCAHTHARTHARARTQRSRPAMRILVARAPPHWLARREAYLTLFKKRATVEQESSFEFFSRPAPRLMSGRGSAHKLALKLGFGAGSMEA